MKISPHHVSCPQRKLVWLFVHEAAVGRIGAYVGAIPPVTVSMFLANRFWTFADHN